jgi:hypothetical protein
MFTGREKSRDNIITTTQSRESLELSARKLVNVDSVESFQKIDDLDHGYIDITNQKQNRNQISILNTNQPSTRQDSESKM